MEVAAEPRRASMPPKNSSRCSRFYPNRTATCGSGQPNSDRRVHGIYDPGKWRSQPSPGAHPCHPKTHLGALASIQIEPRPAGAVSRIQIGGFMEYMIPVNGGRSRAPARIHATQKLISVLSLLSK